LGDADSAECILIDPVVELAKRDFQLTKDLNLKLVYAGKAFLYRFCFKMKEILFYYYNRQIMQLCTTYG
jgi:hypothetical protein